MAEREYYLKTTGKTFSGQAGVYVLVIGESHNKNHMSAYGYRRDTTPWLNSMKNKDRTIIFQNVYACHVNTVPVLTYALTQKNQYNNVRLYNAISLVEACELAGFDTIWLSNQMKYGVYDSPITSIALRSKQQIWINSNIGERVGQDFYDEELVKYLDAVKIRHNVLIIVHLMGNHASYNKRYHKKFNVFGENSSVDCYDNSVLYNDYVMQHIYERCLKIPNFQALVYVSDHSDDVDKGVWHDSSQFTMGMTEIPMYVLFSNRYDTSKCEKFRASQKRFITNDLLFDFMLSIMDIRIDAIYEPQNDVISETYDDDRYRFKTLHGAMSLFNACK